MPWCINKSGMRKSNYNFFFQKILKQQRQVNDLVLNQLRMGKLAGEIRRIMQSLHPPATDAQIDMAFQKYH